MAGISLRNLKKSYGPLAVLHGIDMEIEDGEFVVIVGPSGCGKSTLLRMVAGLEAVTSGEIRIDGRLVNDVEPADRNIAMVFQNYALYPHMTVRQNLSYGLRIRGMNPNEVGRRVVAVAESLGIDLLLDRKPRELSGGQRQRVAMGRAIVREPAVFLFDEPLSNLDAKLRVQMRLELEQLHQRLGTTCLYVTHDQVEAMTLADRMMVLRDGRIEQIGTPADVYARPATRFVAEFIGSPPMNLVPGVLDSDRLLGVRPEHLRPCAAEEALFQVEVQLVENLGPDVYAYGLVGTHPVVVRLPEQRLPEERLSAPGQPLPVRARPEHLHVFEAATGRRLASPEDAAPMPLGDPILRGAPGA